MAATNFSAGIAGGVSNVISPNDEMYRFALSRIGTEEGARNYYFETGFDLNRNLLKLLEGEGLDPKQLDLLEYAAGYGRVTRWFVPDFRSVTVCDLEPDMIEFDRKELGVAGFTVSTRPREIKPIQTFDIVFVFSLMTHLPKRTWTSWLEAISRFVRPGGLLVFSAHSYELFALLNPERFGDPKSWKDEFVFWQSNETEGRLDTASYGTNIVKESFVRKQIQKLRRFSDVRRFAMGEFDRYHDIYVARRTR